MALSRHRLRERGTAEVGSYNGYCRCTARGREDPLDSEDSSEDRRIQYVS
jgi:hypothetical protein